MRGKIFYGTMGGGSGSSGSIFLQPASGGPISGTLQQIADNAGNNSALWLSNAAANIGVGTITNNGALTIKGSGGNITSLRDTANVEVAFVSGTGLIVGAQIVSQGSMAIGNGTVNLLPISDGIFRLTNAGVNNFTRFIFGTNDTSGTSFVKNLTEMRCMLGDGSLYAAFRALSFQSEKLSSGSLANSYPFRVGDIGEITEPELLSLGLTRQLAFEVKGQICYIPFSSSLIP